MPQIELDVRRLKDSHLCSQCIDGHRCAELAVAVWHGLSSAGPFTVLRCTQHDADTSTRMSTLPLGHPAECRREGYVTPELLKATAAKVALEAEIEKRGACYRCFKEGKDSPVAAWAPNSGMCDRHLRENKDEVAKRYGMATYDAETEARNRVNVAKRKKSNRAKAKQARRARKRKK